MAKRSSNYETHPFYCLKCGNKQYIMRNRGFQRSDGHRKRLYCPWCKTEVNHIECKSFDDIQTFTINFTNGVYAQEAEESVKFISKGMVVVK